MWYSLCVRLYQGMTDPRHSVTMAPSILESCIANCPFSLMKIPVQQALHYYTEISELSFWVHWLLLTIIVEKISQQE